MRRQAVGCGTSLITGNQMLFKMPYVFHAAVVPHGKRNPVSLAFGSHMEIEIQEADPVDAPKVLEWSRQGYGDRPRAMSARMIDGRFHVAAMDDDDNHLLAADLAWDDIHSFPHVGPVSDEKPISQFISGKLSHSVSDYRQCVGSDEEAVRDAVRASAERLMVVDGVVYRPHPVPIIRTSVDSFRDGERLRLDIDYDVVKSGGPNILHFPIQHLDKAEAWADEVTRASRGHMILENRVQAILHRPDLLPDPDFFTTDLVRTLDSVLSGQEKVLFIMPDHFIDAWQELRRARNALEPGCSGERVEWAMAAWAAYNESHDAVERERHARHGHEYFPENESEHRRYAYFLPRWEGRDIDIDLGTDLVRKATF